MMEEAIFIPQIDISPVMKISLLIGLVFSPIAALMAFLITYEEYSKHFKDQARPIKMSLETATFTFIVFMGLSILIGVLTNNI